MPITAQDYKRLTVLGRYSGVGKTPTANAVLDWDTFTVAEWENYSARQHADFVAYASDASTNRGYTVIEQGSKRLAAIAEGNAYRITQGSKRASVLIAENVYSITQGSRRTSELITESIYSITQGSKRISQTTEQNAYSITQGYSIITLAAGSK